MNPQIRDAELFHRRLRFESRALGLALMILGAACGFAAMAALLLGFPAHAQEAAAAAPVVASSTPVWLSLLELLLPIIIGGVLLLKPFAKLADFLHAKTLDANASTAAKSMLILGEHLATSLEQYLEESESDLEAIAGDPAKRASALKALEDRAKSEVPALVAAAVGAAGNAALSGKAVQVLNRAVDKAAAANPPKPTV